MARRDMVVIGASSGGIEALLQLVGGLPSDFPAATFVVLHVRPDAPSQLPAILNRAGALPAAHAVDQEPIRIGRIYVAPPGCQTYVQRGRISVRRGPIENLHRPAIDPLFRTAAHYFGPRVVGIVLSGALDDGTAGLSAIKHAGGVTIVQDPDDARVPGMPQHAARIGPDYVTRVRDLPDLLTGVVKTEAPTQLHAEVALETVEEALAPAEAKRSDELGPPSIFTCPECQGTLFEVVDRYVLRFRCRVGHGYSEQTILKAQEETVERALWSALRSLEERSALIKKLGEAAMERGHESVSELFLERARHVEEDVKALHDLILAGRALETIVEEA